MSLSHGKAAVCLCVCRVFTFSNVFSSGTIGPIEVKFLVEPPWNGRTKVYIWGPGLMTKMAAMPIHVYGKDLQKSSPNRWADLHETW